MEKRFIGIICCLISFSLANAQISVVDGLRFYAYSLSQASFAGIEDTALYSSSTSLVIPNIVKIDGSTRTVDKIKENALSGFDNFEEITLPNSVSSIGYKAFENCSKLKRISIPNELYSLDSEAFMGCSGLEKIDLSNTSVMQIPDRCFYGCSSLDSLFIHKNIMSIYDSAFAYCGIRYLEIESSRTYLNKGVFAECKKLETIILPEQMSDLGTGTFSGCSALEKFHLPENLSTINEELFKNCTSLDSLVLHSNIKTIYSDAFDGCENLKTIFNKTSLALTKGATEYGKVAYYANKIISADFEIDGIGYKLITVNKIKKAEVCSNISDYTGDIEIPSTVTFENTIYDVYSIGCEAFSNTTNLSSIKLPNTVKEIKQNAFKYSSIKEISLGDSLKTIGDQAFSNCYNLTSISIPSTMTNIGTSAFMGCEKLKTVTNDSYLELTKGGSTYGYVAKYAEVLTNNKFTIFENLKFYVTSKSTAELKGVIEKKAEITIPEKVTIGNVTYTVNKIASAAFKGHSNLTSVTLPSTLDTIGSEAFMNCTKLNNLTIPSNLKAIESNAFYKCTKLQNITNHSNLDIKAGSEDFGYVAYYTNIISGNKYLFIFQHENKLKIKVSEIDSIGISKSDIPSAKFMESFVNADYDKCPDNLHDNAYFYVWCKDQTIKLKTDGVTTLFANDYKENFITVDQETETVNGYDYVDLGLPSGTKWATVNHEASCPVGVGSFFLYNEILYLNDYQYTVPDHDDVRELILNCRWVLYSYDKFQTGYFMVIGPNGNHIILPTTGDYVDYDKTGDFILSGINLGFYWSIYDPTNKCPSAKWQAYEYDETWTTCYGSEPDDYTKRPVRFILKK